MLFRRLLNYLTDPITSDPDVGDVPIFDGSRFVAGPGGAPAWLFHTPSIPDNSVGSNGDYALGQDGVIYKKQAGTWGAYGGGGGGPPGTGAVFTKGAGDGQELIGGDFNLLQLVADLSNLGDDFEAGGDAMGGLLVKTAGTYFFEWTVDASGGTTGSAEWDAYDIELNNSSDDVSLGNNLGPLAWRGMLWSDKPQVISRSAIRKVLTPPWNMTLIGTPRSGQDLFAPQAILRATRLS